jgi:hypothetical protein
VTDDEWKRIVLRTIKRVAQRQVSLTTDDVWEQLALLDLEIPLIDARAIGTQMRQAAKLGYIIGTQMYVPSTRQVCHHRPVKVWSSELI